MKKILYVDCLSGISGDMTIGAFLDLGVDSDYLKQELSKLHIHGYRLEVKKKTMRGITGTDFDVILEDHEHQEQDHEYHDSQHHNHDESFNNQGHSHEEAHHHDEACVEHGSHSHTHAHTHAQAHPHPHRSHDHDNHHEDHAHGGDHHHHHEHNNWGQIRDLIETSSLKNEVKSLALRIFKRVAEAEAKVHGVSLDEVHFHEVGAIDSIVDIVGAAICFDAIKPDRVVFSPLNTGSGTVRCSHGILPVPAPATSEILAQRHAMIYSSGILGELVTPTGAAIAAELASEFGGLPAIQIDKTAFGTGKKDFGIPNVLRMIFGSVADSSGETDSNRDKVMVIEANIDDMTGETAGYTLERLMAEGALDAFYTPIYMKKNRPAVKLSVLCSEDQSRRLERIILAETTTIGLRKYLTQRTVMKRETVIVNLPYGEAVVKICEYDGIKKSSPEYESVRELAQKTGLSLISIYKDIYGMIDLI